MVNPTLSTDNVLTWEKGAESLTREGAIRHASELENGDRPSPLKRITGIPKKLVRLLFRGEPLRFLVHPWVCEQSCGVDISPPKSRIDRPLSRLWVNIESR